MAAYQNSRPQGWTAKGSKKLDKALIRAEWLLVSTPGLFHTLDIHTLPYDQLIKVQQTI